MPFVSITRLRIRGDEQLDTFNVVLPAVFGQATGAPGQLAMDLLAEPDNTFWTRTVWPT
jgi:hypothetical protein